MERGYYQILKKAMVIELDDNWGKPETIGYKLIENGKIVKSEKATFIKKNVKDNVIFVETFSNLLKWIADKYHQNVVEYPYFENGYENDTRMGELYHKLLDKKLITEFEFLDPDTIFENSFDVSYENYGKIRKGLDRNHFLKIKEIKEKVFLDDIARIVESLYIKLDNLKSLIKKESKDYKRLKEEIWHLENDIDDICQINKINENNNLELEEILGTKRNMKECGIKKASYSFL